MLPIVIPKTHAALLASQGMGHLIPMLELAKRLLMHNFKITLFVATTDHNSHPMSKLSETASYIPPNDIEIVMLPRIHDDDQSRHDVQKTTTVTIFRKLLIMMHESISSLPSILAAMESPPSVLIVDMFGTEAIKIAKDFGILSYVFFTSQAWYLAEAIYVSAGLLDEEVKPDQVLKIPGCKEIRYEDLANPVYAWGTKDYDEYARTGYEMTAYADGILVNTWLDLERATVDALNHNEILKQHFKVPVLTIGPIIRPTTPRSQLSSDSVSVLVWLDKQPKESVVFVSFGSGGTLSKHQTAELAMGLEMSKQRFMWVMRPPMENNVSASLFASTTIDNIETSKFVPTGFSDRTQEVGKVVLKWAPQVDILSHPSIGAFMSHCGWNSILESMYHGVPIIAWPLYAEQKMNATMLTEDIKNAVRSKALPSKETIGREEIDRMVRRIMVGEEATAFRSRAKELQSSAQDALKEGGCSNRTLYQMVRACQTHELKKKKVDDGN